MEEILVTMADNWVYWAVSIFAIIAAYIDGKELRVPNKITFPMIISGWIYSAIFYGMDGQGWYIGLMKKIRSYLGRGQIDLNEVTDSNSAARRHVKKSG